MFMRRIEGQRAATAACTMRAVICALRRMWPCALAVLLCNVAAAVKVATDPFEVIQRERAAFLCDWSKTHSPSVNPEPLTFCQASEQATIDAIRAQTAAWWKYWEQKDESAENSLRDSFDSDWRDLRQRQQAEFQRKDEEEFSRSIHKLSTLELCVNYHDRDSNAAYTELKKRNALSASEWSLVHRQSIQIGMSELALICSWGSSSHVNRTVTQYRVHKQYVYGSTLVYVEDGRVTSFQDRE